MNWLQKRLRRVKLPSFSRIQRLVRRYRKRLTRTNLAVMAIVVVLLIGVVYKSTMTQIDPTAYASLLNTIAKGESNGNYNAYFGHAGNTTILFTEMSVSQVQQWQEEYVRQGSASSAVGRYQIIRPTLAGLVRQLHIDPNAQFDEKMQDRLAIALLERRGSIAYVEKKLTREEFAANLAKEWAALPKVTGPAAHESYYAGDGLNRSHISPEEILGAIAKLKS